MDLRNPWIALRKPWVRTLCGQSMDCAYTYVSILFFIFYFLFFILFYFLFFFIFFIYVRAWLA